MFSFKKDTNRYLLFVQKKLFLFYICFGKIDAKKCFITQNTKPFILHYFLTLVSPLPPTPFLFLFFPFNYHFSSNKKLPPTHNNPTPSPMTSLSEPLNPTIERKPAYPKLNTITWTNPKKKKKKPTLMRNQANRATYCCCNNDSLPIRCCCREREREIEIKNDGGMAPRLQRQIVNFSCGFWLCLTTIRSTT